MNRGEIQPGDVLSERFRIERLASSGGMGRVYRAVDLADGEIVAVKVLIQGVPDGDRYFAREIDALARVDHPRIVRYIDRGVSQDGPFFAMEWVEGDDLRRRLAGHKRLRIDEVVRLGVQLADALGHAHARGIVHRDVKPGNIVLALGDLEQPKLVDFGLATTTADSDTFGSLVGTPGYMAPEQALGQPLDGRADVFALGCLLYKALTGRAPFAAADAMASLAKVFFDEPPLPSVARLDIPSALEDAVLRMLTKSADERPTSARALEALRAVDVNAPVTHLSRPPALTDRELRIVSVLVAGRSMRAAEESTMRADAVMPARVAAALRAEGAKLGARVEIIGDIAIATLSSSHGSATDQAARAARLALTLHTIIPETPMALATGRAEVGARVVGEVIDRAVERVRAAPENARGTLVDEVTSGLLGPAFEVADDHGALVLVRERAIGSSPVRTFLGKPAPLVGRDSDLARIDAAYDACVRDRAPRGVLVVAGAGVGKSRLRHEWSNRLSLATTPPLVFFARADAMTTASPHGLLAQLVRGAASIDAGDSREAARARLRGRIARSVPATHAQRVAQFLGEVAGVPFDDVDDPELRAARQDPMLMSDQVLLAWETWIRAESTSAPVVLVLEDVHWADSATMRAIERLLRASGDDGGPASIFVLMLARPALGELPAIVERLDLGDLGADAADALAAFVLGERASEPRVREMIAKAAGNAFFLEEILRAIASGKDDVPETVLAIVEQRLERTTAAGRRVLRAASVLGLACWDDAVASLLDDSSAEISPMLDALVAEELLGPSAKTRLPGQRELRFRHALVRDAAYAMLTEDDRAHGHALAGSWLEAHGEWDAATLAQHFERGRKRARAVVHYRRATLQALEASDLVAVVDIADRGLRCDPTPPDRGELQRARAEAFRWRGKLAEAADAAADAMKFLPIASAGWCKAAAELATASAGLGRTAEVRTVGKTLVETARAGADASLTIALARVAGQLRTIGARDDADAIVTTLRSRPQSEPLARARTEQAFAYEALYASDIGGYYEHMSAARRLFEQVGDRRNACVQAVNMGYVAVQAGALDEAEEALVASLRTAESLGIERTRAIFLHNIGLLRHLQGRLDESIALQHRALAVFSAQGDRRLEAFSRMYMSWALLKRGDVDAAVTAAESAIEAAGPMLPAQASARATLADALLRRGDVEGALREARAAHDTMIEIGGLEDTESLVYVVFADALVAAGKRDEARAIITTAQRSIGERAKKIQNPAWRESFLSRVPEHVRITELAHTLDLPTLHF